MKCGCEKEKQEKKKSPGKEKHRKNKKQKNKKQKTKNTDLLGFACLSDCPKEIAFLLSLSLSLSLSLPLPLSLSLSLFSQLLKGKEKNPRIEVPDATRVGFRLTEERVGSCKKEMNAARISKKV